MGDSFNLKIYIPSGLVLEETVESVTIPSSTGEIVILPGHISYVGLLGTGILEYSSSRAGVKRLVISGGFVNFADNILTLLADTIDLPESVGSLDLMNRKSEFTKIYQGGDTQDPEWGHAEQQLRRIESIERMAN